MKSLIKYLDNYKKECFIAPLFKMLEAIFELFVPLVVAGIIDKGIGNGDNRVVMHSALLMILLGIVGLISAVTAQYFAAKAATGFSTALRHDLFKHLLSLSHKEIDNIGTSTMITRMTSDVNTAQTGVNMFLRLFLRSPFIVFGAMIMAFTIDAQIAFVFVGLIVVLFLAVGLIMYFNIPLLKKVQSWLDKITLLTRENLQGVRVIRAFTMEEKEELGFKEDNNRLYAAQKNAGFMSALLNPLTYVLVNLAICLLLYEGAIKVNAGYLTQGKVVALYNYMSQILVELIKFANLIVTINKALASSDRIADVFKINNSLHIIEGTDLSDSKAIEFKNVSFKYNETGDDAVSNISFSIEKGKTIGIVGGTGSGKSTIVNLIPRFYDVNSGAIYVDGKNVNSYRLEDLRNRMGIVPQKAVLFKGTIADNLRWGNENATDEELISAIECAAASDVLEAKGSLDALIEQGGRNLSGGQRQRLTIARALVRKPEILILDDSASALDFATDLKLRKAISELDYNPTVVIVAQRASSVQNADTILVMDDGNLVGMGNHNDLIDNCAVYKEIYDSQFSREV